MTAPVTVQVRRDAGCDPIDEAWLAEAVERGARRVAHSNAVSFGTIAVRVVSDQVMTELHERFCGDRSTTDVLTFERPGSSEGQENAEDLASREHSTDVDLVLCRDEAARQAAARGLPLERELLLYAIHGLLHCAGHDDHDPEAFARMHAEEDRILEAIGVGRTFAAPQQTGADHARPTNGAGQ